MITIIFFILFDDQKSPGSAVPMVLVINKVDCTPFVAGEQFEKFSGIFRKHVHTCAVTGKGISELERAVIEVRGLEPIPSGGRRWTVNQVNISVCHQLKPSSSAL
jgi:tRNA modification GTPase